MNRIDQLLQQMIAETSQQVLPTVYSATMLAGLQELQSLTAGIEAQRAFAQQGVAASAMSNKIELTHYQIKALLELSEASGDPECCDDLVLQMGGEKAHSGPGLYAWYDECPEEGATFIGRDAEDQARGDAIAEGHGHE